MICLPVFLAAHIARFLSGTQMTLSSGSDSITFTTFDEVQQTSLSALISAVVFTYATTGTPGYCDLMSLSVKLWGKTNEGWTSYPGYAGLTDLGASTWIISAMGQEASISERSTVFSGESIDALSAIKSTPQKTMTSQSIAAAFRESSRESPTKSAMSCTSPLW